MTVATVIYYSGYHPYTLQPTRTPKTKKEKDQQHRFFFWYKKENQNWIKNTLFNLGRKDLAEKLVPSTQNKNWQRVPTRKVKNTFDDAIPSGKRMGKSKPKGRKKRR
jgi:hypothetical protein